ncbi:hypothetical protein KC336_g19534, partial [Hortaea werneckii]
PVPTIDQDIQTDTPNNNRNPSTSTDLITPPSPPYHHAPSYQDTATQTDISLASSLLPPRYYAPDAYGIEQSGEAVTELALVDGESEGDVSSAVGSEEGEDGERMDDEEDDEEEADEEEEDDEYAITTSPSSPTNDDDPEHDGDDTSRPPTLPHESVKEAMSSSPPERQQHQQQEPRKPKSAWAELWEGLGHLAGVGGGDDEDEDGDEEGY